MKKLLNFFLLDKKTMLLLIETYFFLAWARFLVSRPFSKVAPSLGLQMQETPSTQIQENYAILKNVAHAIKIISNHTLWESKCLVRAIAGMKMLYRRGIESTLYLGTAKDETGEMIAHAWLRSGSFYVTGSEVMSRFTIVGKFAKRISKH